MSEKCQEPTSSDAKDPWSVDLGLPSATDQPATRQLSAFIGALPKSHRISELDFGLPK